MRIETENRIKEEIGKQERPIKKKELQERSNNKKEGKKVNEGKIKESGKKERL